MCEVVQEYATAILDTSEQAAGDLELRDRVSGNRAREVERFRWAPEGVPGDAACLSGVGERSDRRGAQVASEGTARLRFEVAKNVVLLEKFDEASAARIDAW